MVLCLVWNLVRLTAKNLGKYLVHLLVILMVLTRDYIRMFNGLWWRQSVLSKQLGCGDFVPQFRLIYFVG